MQTEVFKIIFRVFLEKNSWLGVNKYRLESSDENKMFQTGWVQY